MKKIYLILIFLFIIFSPIVRAEKNNNAYDYVTLPNSDKTYTIKQYQKMFIMN